VVSLRCWHRLLRPVYLAAAPFLNGIHRVMRTALITGASGMIGGYVTKRLSAEDFFTVGISRSQVAIPHARLAVARALGEPLSDIIHDRPIDLAVHCAYEFSPQGAEVSRRGTIAWAEELRAAGTKRQILVSSISAGPTALSAYGRGKFQTEEWFQQNGGIVLRPGLVIGNGGLFGRMVHLVRRLPVVPVIGGVGTRLYVTGLESLGTFVVRAIERPYHEKCLFSVQQPKPCTLHELLRTISRTLGVRRLLIPVPYWVCWAGISIAKATRLPVGINPDNLIGMRQNSIMDLDSDFLLLGGQPEDISVLVQKAGLLSVSVGAT
jgi:nucleoside-diphosphate-sugar epimerase